MKVIGFVVVLTALLLFVDEEDYDGNLSLKRLEVEGVVQVIVVEEFLSRLDNDKQRTRSGNEARSHTVQRKE